MSQREINITVPASAAIPVRAAGDFIFCKSAARPVIVRINGQAITMRAGDKQRLDRSVSDPQKPAFDIFELDNSNSTLPLATVLVVGVGDYNSQIVSGELIVAPGIRTADGSYVTDSRHDERINIAMLAYSGVTETSGTLKVSGVDSGLGSPEFSACIVKDEIWCMTNGDTRIAYYNRENGELRGVYNTSLPGSFAAMDMAFDGRRTLFVTGYLTSSSSVARLYAIDTDFFGAQGIALGVSGPNFYYCAGVALSEKYLYVKFTDNGTQPKWLQIRKRDFPYELIDTIELTGAPSAQSYGMFYAASENSLYLARQSSHPTKWKLSGDGRSITYEGPAEASGFTNAGGMDYDEENNSIICGQGGMSYVERTFKNAVYYGIGYATTDQAQYLIEPEKWNYIRSGIITTKYGARRAMAGPVIAAIVEMLTGKVAPAGYLDYVYGFSYFDPQQKRQRSKVSGGESFLAAGVTDNFITEVPGAVVLTVREGLI